MNTIRKQITLNLLNLKNLISQRNLTLATLFIVTSILSTVAQKKKISSEFPYDSKYIEVKGSKMHYIEEYADKTDENQLTFLFIHGNPTSSYLWRNIIPYVKGKGKVVAFDLIGMGKSDKPDLDYTFKDHIGYVDEFIRLKKLKNIVLVVHDWGSALGFNYASQHEDNIKGMVFMEAFTMAELKWKDFNIAERFLFKRFRHPKRGHRMNAKNNFFVKTLLPVLGTKRRLSKKEKAYYKAPFPTVESRKPVEMWPKEIPIEGLPVESTKIVKKFNAWLEQTTIPKLLLYAKPGMVIKKKEVARVKRTFKNLEGVYIGKGVHFVQEDHPHEIGKAIKEWLKKTEL